MPTSLKPSPRPQPATTPSSDRGVPLRTIVLATAALAAIGLLIGLLWPRTDHRAGFDSQVEEQWISGRELVRATEFFAGGGIYESADASRSIDQQLLVPLIERLEQEHRLEFEVIVEPSQPQLASALIAQIPTERDSRNAIRSAILQASEQFPGFLHQYWGHHWLSLDYFDEQELPALERAGVLRRLKASQRRME